MGKSMQDRKKNQFDPIANPAYFFRKNNDDAKNVKVDFLFGRVSSNRVASAKPPVMKNINSS